MYENPHDIIKSLLRTEKGSHLLTQNKYVFWVANSANRIQIKKAVEEIFKIHVTNVNTMRVRGKLKRVRYKLGRTSSWKKAIVTIKKGETIAIATT